MIYLLMFGLYLTASLSAVIIKTNNLQPLLQIFNELDENSLVLFDVDETLIIAQDAILQPRAQPLLERCVKKILENPKFVNTVNYEQTYLLSQILSKMKFNLIEPQSVDLIYELQDRGIRTIALTAMRTGSFGIIPNMEDWRIQQLKELGITFTSAFSNYPYFALPPIDGYCPVFKQGVLCADRYSKGKTLLAFLEQVKWKPYRIVFIDNKWSFLKSVEKALKNTGIEFIGFYYKGADSYPQNLDRKVVDFQFQRLLEQGEWLSDKEVQVLLEALKPKETPAVDDETKAEETTDEAGTETETTADEPEPVLTTAESATTDAALEPMADAIPTTSS